jgi:hypothetical protein
MGTAAPSTPLQAETTFRYEACVARGEHLYDREVVRRPPVREMGQGYVELRVCLACGVPEPPPKAPWMARTRIPPRPSRAPRAVGHTRQALSPQRPCGICSDLYQPFNRQQIACSEACKVEMRRRAQQARHRRRVRKATDG